MSSRRSHAKPMLLLGNHFHRCDHTSDDSHNEALALSWWLRSVRPEGLKEQALLEWFGASTARMALLAHASGRPPPHFVAREFILGDMRADFALLEVPMTPDVPPRLVLIEFQGALPNSLFEARGRTFHYWGRDFLDGFSQLMDWHFAGYHATLSQKVATLVADCRRPVDTTFMLVAFLRQFSKDALSERRLVWWSDTVSLGSNFRAVRFDDVANEALYWLESCGRWAPGLPPDAVKKPGDDIPPRRAVMLAPRNNKAALARRPHGLSGAGAGT
ncbi:hypothetical protein CDL60_25180 [Roseateles noduli]|nr:hypothetical protein CDL60_25180 [Roseateles noduli]